MSDKVAMAFSSVCAIHCFFSPAFVLLTSGLFSISLDNESVHYLILFAAIPISLYALISGFANHKTFYLLVAGIIGLFILVLAVALGASVLGELGEKTLTLAGSIMVVFAHFKNHQICKELACSCHDESLIN